MLPAAGDTEGAGPAEASLTDFALTCTVLTRTGFIGSVAPGTASMGWVLITPLVKAAMAHADSGAEVQPRTVQKNGALKPVASHSGWIIQVGALETESQARERLDTARGRAPQDVGQGRSLH